MLSKRLSAIVVTAFLIAATALSAQAITEVRCIGGGGTTYKTHNYGLFWLKSHMYAEYYHDVDRVYDGVVYGTEGHDSIDCGTSDYYSYCPPGTVVGEAP